MSRLRAGLVGLGVMGRNHARILAGLEEVDFVGVADPAAVAHPENKFWTTPDLEELLDQGLDYAVVATPTTQHLEVAMRLVAAGIPALIEKPLAGSNLAAQEIAAAFADQGLLASVGHIERYNPAVSEAQKRISDGQLGAILQISTRRVGPHPTRITDTSIVHDFGIHDIDLAHWLGNSSYSSVSGSGRNWYEAGRHDCLSITGTSNSGIVLSHVINWISPYRDRTLVVTGEKGVFEIDTLSANLTFKAGSPADAPLEDWPYFQTLQAGDVVTYAFERPEPLLLQHIAFRDAVKGTGGFTVPLNEARHAVEVADAAVLSAEQGRVVHLGDANK